MSWQHSSHVRCCCFCGSHMPEQQAAAYQFGLKIQWVCIECSPIVWGILQKIEAAFTEEKKS